MRNALGKALADIYPRDDRHHLFCGDIGFGVFDALRDRTPKQFHNFGISEQHMVSFAAAFATTVQATSVVYTINPFITSRVHDQLRVDVAYANAPLIICSVGAGFAYDSLGFTHYGLEDLALIGALPNIQILTPSEPDDVTDLVSELFAVRAINHPRYLRLQKGGEPSLKARYPDFASGPSSYRYWPGADLEIVTHGAIAEEALKARELLKGLVSVSVRTIIDWAAYFAQEARAPKLAKKVIFLEEHRNTGLLAHRFLERVTRTSHVSIRCVENSDFSTCVLRHSSLCANRLDADSLVEHIRMMDS